MNLSIYSKKLNQKNTYYNNENMRGKFFNYNLNLHIITKEKRDILIETKNNL